MRTFFGRKRHFSLVLVSFLICFFLFPTPVYSYSVKTNTGMEVRGLDRQSDNVSDLVDIKQKDGKMIPNRQYGTQQDGALMDTMFQLIDVHVLGDVKIPGIYKVKVSDRAADIVKLADPSRERTRIIQIRHPGEKTRYYDLYRYFYNGDLSQNPYLKDNDVIFVPQPKGTIRIEGSVERPGIYELWGEKNLDQIVKLAGGFTEGMSKMYPVKVIRFSDGGEKFVLDVVQKSSTMKKFSILKGDIVVVRDVINAPDQFDYTVESIPGEHHVYPTAVPEVFVIGAVTAPGPYPYKSHLSIKDYLGYAGATANANLNSVRVVTGTKNKRKKLYDKVQAGDVIMVKQKGLNNVVKYIGIAATVLSLTLSVIVLRDSLKD